MARKKNDDPKQRLANERFSELLRQVVNEHDTLKAAILLGVAAEATVRNWLQKVPPTKKNRDHAMQRLNLDPRLLEDDERQWTEFLGNLKNGRVNLPSVIDRPEWLYYSEHINAAEKYTNAAQIIIITKHALNDTQLGLVHDTVAGNLKRGISYTFVIPEFCSNKARLITQVAFLRQNLKSASDEVASVDIMLVKTDTATEADWQWIDEVMLFLRRRLPPHEIAQHLEIERSWEQLYAANDRLNDSRKSIGNENIWAMLPFQKQEFYVGLLQRWAATAQWI
jgi:hypothetical protein